MDGREGMAIPGSASYYIHRGIAGAGSESGTHALPGFRHFSNPHNSFQPNLRDSSVGLALPLENPSPPNFSQGLNINVSSSGDPVKKKRGRPRKYGPDGSNMSLGLSPMSANTSQALMSQTPKRARGRPPGSGRKQQLAQLGEWMNSSAGLAFTPHVIHVAVGEDVSTKILSFAQQRPRALCILSGNGAVSAVTLRQPASSAGTFTYEGRFQILCLSGSYLVNESGAPRDRTGGLSISVCSHDGHVFGGGVGGRLIAAGPVQVVVCSFVYGGKTKTKTEATASDEQDTKPQHSEKSIMPASAPPTQNLTPNSAMGMWPISRTDMRNLHSGIDLTRG